MKSLNIYQKIVTIVSRDRPIEIREKDQFRCSLVFLGFRHRRAQADLRSPAPRSSCLRDLSEVWNRNLCFKSK